METLVLFSKKEIAQIIDRSLTSVVSKMLEKIVRGELLTVLTENKLVTKAQNGLVPSKSGLNLKH